MRRAPPVNRISNCGSNPCRTSKCGVHLQRAALPTAVLIIAALPTATCTSSELRPHQITTHEPNHYPNPTKHITERKQIYYILTWTPATNPSKAAERMPETQRQRRGRREKEGGRRGCRSTVLGRCGF
ncbi:hypothetical protein LR48_Vigan07g054200 [Vigna angularis]|uniref:Uncharacterized protein n=1 Tax=Phaseolus angularis TaxID=3914 RepID=A0A0L9UVQ0_PHAAN|nr:hypothetical protein LR48_Vigan07g054200 [Vigna angularis]